MRLSKQRDEIGRSTANQTTGRGSGEPALDRPAPPAGKSASQLPVLPSAGPANAARACPLLLDADGEEWVACCTRRFLPLARRIAGGNDQAADALQASWIKVLQGIRAYRGGSPACGWVRRIVHNCVLDFATSDHARASRIPVAELVDVLEDPSPSPETLARRRQLYILLKAVIAELPRIYRQVIELRYGQQLSTGETAALLHVSRSSVSTRLARAVKILRHLMNTRIRAGDCAGKRAELMHRPGAKRSGECPRTGAPRRI